VFIKAVTRNESVDSIITPYTVALLWTCCRTVRRQQRIRGMIKDTEDSRIQTI